MGRNPVLNGQWMDVVKTALENVTKPLKPVIFPDNQDNIILEFQ